MTRPRYQDGSLVIRGKRKKQCLIRWREDVVRSDGTIVRVQRAQTLGPVSRISRQQALEVLRSRVSSPNQQRCPTNAFVTFSEFVSAEWKPNAALTLKKSSMRIYGFNLEKHILPGLGAVPLRNLSRAQIESCLSRLRSKGHATSTVRSVRATFSTILQAAVERGCVEKNAARGIRIREADTATRERRFYSASQIRMLLGVLTEPCRTVVSIAVSAGLRIGEILALRWKRVDLLRGTIAIAETYSDREFGSPKTKSSRRVIPISLTLRSILESCRASSKKSGPEELVFQTPTGTPLDAHNLYNRELAPACDWIKQPRISWHSFRHSHATLLSETGESLKTAQALLGHSDLETTLAVYTHVVPDSQKRAVEQVAGVLFSDVLNSASEQHPSGHVN